MDVEVTRSTDSATRRLPWEVSRAHHLLTLARAACLFDDDRYQIELESQLVAWIEANPVGYGINWVNPMEVAIRSVNWVWALEILEQRGGLREPTRAAVSYARSRRTGDTSQPTSKAARGCGAITTLADVLGLLVLGATVRDDAAARSWLEEWPLGVREADSGAGARRRTRLRSLVAVPRASAGDVPPGSPRQRMGCAAALGIVRPETSADARHDSLRPASQRQAPSDWRLRQRPDPAHSVDRPPTADPVLWLGASIMGGDVPLDGMPDAGVAWTLGVDEWSKLVGRSVAAPAAGRAFPEGGIYVLSGGGLAYSRTLW